MTILSKVLVLGAVCPVLGPAQTKPREKRSAPDIAYEKCTAIPKNQSTAGLAQCALTAYDAWDKELNTVYRKLLAVLDAEGKQNLKAAQIEWLKFRDAEMKLYTTIHDRLQGTMYIVIFADRRVTLVKQRVVELQELLDLASGQ